MSWPEARLEFLTRMLNYHLREVERIRKEMDAHLSGRTFPTAQEPGDKIYFSEGAFDVWEDNTK